MRTPLALFQVKREDVDSPRDSVDSQVGLRPSRRAVAELARTSGYTSFEVLRPRFSHWEGGRAYKAGSRRAFICSKLTPLVGLDTEPVDAFDPRPIRFLRFPSRTRARRLGKRARRYAGPTRGRVRGFLDNHRGGPTSAPALRLTPWSLPRVDSISGMSYKRASG